MDWDRILMRVLVWLIGAMGLVALYLLSAFPAQAQIPDAARGFQREYVRVVRSEWGIDAPVASLAAQIAQESGWRDGLTSRVGAKGLAQFMPTTADWINEIHPELQADALYSRAWSMRAQAVYMKWLVGRVRGAENACERFAFALCGYNGGERWVRQRQALSKTPGRCFDATCRINPGIHPANQRENEEYPVRIERHWAPRFYLAGWGKMACS